MDIVHKFLNRDVEHEQLKSSVKEAEMRLDTLREQFERFKRDTDGITFDTDTSGKSRAIYLEVEDHEAKLNLCQKEHEQSRDKLQQSTLQVEHMKRWANRMGRSLSMFEDCVRVEKPSDLPVFYQQMQRAVDKFIAHIVQQISSGKVQRKNMSQVASKEYHEARRLLADKDFLKANCRVPASLDAGRPPSRQGATGAPEEDAADVHQQERERCKNESNARVADVMRKVEMQKKKGHYVTIDPSSGISGHNFWSPEQMEVLVALLLGVLVGEAPMNKSLPRQLLAWPFSRSWCRVAQRCWAGQSWRRASWKMFTCGTLFIAT
eukprot:symbB.v1.2.001997.t1/scaffold53.1/size378684/18